MLIKDTYLINLVQIYSINLAQILYAAVREELKYARYEFRVMQQIIISSDRLRVATNLIIINASKYNSSIANSEIMPKAV